MKHIQKLALFAMTVSMMGAKAEKINYPAAPQERVIDEYFGIKVADPYRPLENDTSAITLEWVKAENAVTENYLSKIPYRTSFKKRLEDLNNYEKIGVPTKEKDGYYYFYKNDGLQNQAVLYRTKDLEKEAEVFIDPNKLSADGTVALNGVTHSKDGKYVGYSISRNGSDWEEFYVLDAVSGELLHDHLEWIKFSDMGWKGDGFFYSAYPRPEAGKEYSGANEYHNIYYHKLGTPQSEDILIFEDRENPLHFHSAEVSDDGRWLFLATSGEGIGNSLKVKDLSRDDSDWVVIEESQDYEVYPLEVIDGKVYIYTSKDAPKNKLVVTDVANPAQENWRDLLPESDGVLKAVYFAGANMIAVYDKDASHHAYLYDRNGNKIRDIEMPTYGTIGFSSDKDSDEVFYVFNSFTYPGAIFRYDMTSGNSALWQSKAPEGFNPEDYVTEQVFYTSTDGTKVPMFLVYKKGLKKEGANPVYLYGYGGFNIPMNPGFSPSRLLWLENGGIYAQANLRGGSEYGEEWHLAGTKLHKKNVFNDFISAAEYLVDENWTSPEHIAIVGGSNGGLLVGAVTNMRPDLFKVAIPEVGVMDMMRYHLFTIGWNWASDYGTSDDSKEMAEYLLSYSPLHNVKNDGTPYPAIMVTTADHDDRVVPAHSFKYAATLQAADTGEQPKLIRIDSNAGHGGGKPISKIIDEYADIYSFIFYNMGINPKEY